MGSPNFFDFRTLMTMLVTMVLSCLFETSTSKELKLPEFLEPIPNVTMPSGRDVRLSCVVDHLGSYKVAWIQQDRSAILTVGKHVITRNPRIGVMHDEHRTWYLTITDVRPGDAGTYMCQINTEPVTSQVGVVEVVVPPYIKDDMTSKDVKLHEGSSVSLACSARGSPVPTIKWRREDGKKIRINGTFKAMEVQYPILKLSDLRREDMAAYLCIASNGVPPSVSKRINVEVKFLPKVTAVVQLMSVPLGQTGVLLCNVEAWPKGLNYWMRPGGQGILQDDDKFQTSTKQEKGELYKCVMNLTINNFSLDDIGDYNCISNNSQGGAEEVIRVSGASPISSNPNGIEKRPPIKDTFYRKNSYNSVNWKPHLQSNGMKDVDDTFDKIYKKPDSFEIPPKNKEGFKKQKIFLEPFDPTHQQQSVAITVRNSYLLLPLSLVTLSILRFYNG